MVRLQLLPRLQDKQLKILPAYTRASLSLQSGGDAAFLSPALFQMQPGFHARRSRTCSACHIFHFQALSFKQKLPGVFLRVEPGKHGEKADPCWTMVVHCSCPCCSIHPHRWGRCGEGEGCHLCRAECLAKRVFCEGNMGFPLAWPASWHQLGKTIASIGKRTTEFSLRGNKRWEKNHCILIFLCPEWQPIITVMWIGKCRNSNEGWNEERVGGQRRTKCSAFPITFSLALNGPSGFLL